MILPIRAFGDAVLRKHCHEIDKDYPELKALVENMYDTMDSEHGIGLAAPQIGLDIRLFVVDLSPLAEDEDYADIAEDKSLYDLQRKNATELLELQSNSFVEKQKATL